MATLSKHNVLGIIEYMTKRKAYCLDGTILQDNGSGWKVKSRVKPGLDKEETIKKLYKLALEKQADNRAKYPLYFEFQRKLHQETTKKNRYQVYLAIQLMPDDPDGIWSTLDDYNMRIEIEDLVNLCRLYKCAMDEINGAS